jgi:hypothetical protein
MCKNMSRTGAAQLSKAHRLMTEALNILDDACAPAHVGVHLDLAVSRLEEAMGIDRGLADEVLIEAFEMADNNRSRMPAVDPWSLESSDAVVSSDGTTENVPSTQ